MNLTPQQTMHADTVRQHIQSPDGKTLIIQGVSGAGKTTLVRAVAEDLSLPVLEVEAYGLSEEQKGEISQDTVAVIDFSYHSDRTVDSLREMTSAKCSIVLAHPSALYNGNSRRSTDPLQKFKQELQGRVSVIRLSAMSEEEQSEYLDGLPEITADKRILIEEYGLGLAGHIHTLNSLRDFNPQTVEDATLWKLVQLFSGIGGDDTFEKRIERALGRKIKNRAAARLESLSDPSSLGHIPCFLAKKDLPFSTPKFPETLSLYTKRVIDGGCQRVKIFIPNLSDAAQHELYRHEMVQGYDTPFEKGRMVDFTHYSELVRCGFHSEKISLVHEYMSYGMKKMFDESILEYDNDVEETKIVSPALIAAWAHGGCRNLDNPYPMWAAETYLQGMGIPYEVHYDFPDGAQKYSVGTEEMKRIPKILESDIARKMRETLPKIVLQSDVDQTLMRILPSGTTSGVFYDIDQQSKPLHPKVTVVKIFRHTNRRSIERAGFTLEVLLEDQKSIKFEVGSDSQFDQFKLNKVIAPDKDFDHQDAEGQLMQWLNFCLERECRSKVLQND